MKKVTFALLLVLVAVMVLPSCKKGADDPFISLRSRDGRITAKWKLTKIEGTQISNFGTTVTTTATYDGTTMTTTSSPGGTSTSTGTYEMTIDKQGNVSWAETYASGGSSDVQSGEDHWQWLSSNKNKDYLEIGGGNHFFQGGTFYVDELKGKELILQYTTQNVDNGETSSTDVSYTFTKQ
jgi:hypothetical protein